MKLGILDCGPVAPALRARHGTYSDMFERMLGKAFSFERYVVYEGAFPSDAADADGWIISGSRHGAYDGFDWIPPLEALIREIAASRQPLLGICFGHQIIAQALGGTVVKSEKGWGLGVETYGLTAEGRALDLRLPGETQLLAVHQDQVIACPEGAVVLMSTNHCPVGGLAYGTDGGTDDGPPHILTLQPHPEFDRDFVADLIETRLKNVVPEELSRRALNSLKEDVDGAVWKASIQRFFAQSNAGA